MWDLHSVSQPIAMHVHLCNPFMQLMKLDGVQRPTQETFLALLKQLQEKQQKSLTVLFLGEQSSRYRHRVHSPIMADVRLLTLSYVAQAPVDRSSDPGHIWVMLADQVFLRQALAQSASPVLPGDQGPES